MVSRRDRRTHRGGRGPALCVHINVVLIRADSPEDAYAKAVEAGTNSQIAYENPEGRRVTISHRGLRDLDVILDELEHGVELSYFEHIETDDAAIQQYVSPKEELGVFAPRKPFHGPNYISKTVMEDLRELGFSDLD